MSGLKDRLRRLTGKSAEVNEAESGPASRAEPEQEQENGGGEVHQYSVRVGYTIEPLGAEWEGQDAALVRNEQGAFIRRRRVYEGGHLHGDYRLADLFPYAAELSAFHDEALPGVQADKLLFFDTETTGLGHGAGNVPFITGIGYWEANDFVVEQLFIRHPAEECAMLAYLKPLLKRYPYLVTYNGRAFDWPVLSNRFIMHRMEEGLAVPKHLDFLYSSRSLWRNTMPSCRLGKVEELQLGFNRVDDVPGSMVPELYFLYLAEKDPKSIAPVFLHNELDIVSLGGLAVLFAQALAGMRTGEGKLPEEQYRLGLWLHKMGKADLSRQVLQGLYEAAVGEQTADACAKLLVPLAAHYKQLGQWQQALALWRQAIRTGKQSAGNALPSLVPYVELSMFYEHRVKDHGEALVYAEEALDWVRQRRGAWSDELRRRAAARRRGSGGILDPLAAGLNVAETGMESLQELEKRVHRLQGKLQRAGQAAPPRASDTDQPEFVKLKEIPAAQAPKRRRTGGASRSSPPTLF